MTTEPASDRRVIDLHPDVVGRGNTRVGERRLTTASVLRSRRRNDRELQQYATVLDRLSLAAQMRSPARATPPPAGLQQRTPRQHTSGQHTAGQHTSGQHTGAQRAQRHSGQSAQRTVPRALPCPSCGQSFPGPWLIRHLGTAHPEWRG